MSFEVIPAIDLRDGQVVRLTQGDFARQTTFSDDPAAVAAGWEAAGATTLHVVDLDGATTGEPRNLEAIAAIRRAVGCVLQVGGGLRTDEAISAVLGAGADRIVLGTALIVQPDWVARLCEHLGERVVVGIDVREGMVATEGWLTTSDLTTDAVVRRANRIGVRRGLFTDIGQDGTLAGPNLQALREVVGLSRFEVIASGGVSSLDDIDAIRATGAAAVIVGRALYTRAVDLQEALARSLSC